MHVSLHLAESVDQSEQLCAQLLSVPLPDPLPKDMNEYEAFLRTGVLPVTDMFYQRFIQRYPSLSSSLKVSSLMMQIHLICFSFLTLNGPQSRTLVQT